MHKGMHKNEKNFDAGMKGYGGGGHQNPMTSKAPRGTMWSEGYPMDTSDYRGDGEYGANGGGNLPQHASGAAGGYKASTQASGKS